MNLKNKMSSLVPPVNALILLAFVISLGRLTAGGGDIVRRSSDGNYEAKGRVYDVGSILAIKSLLHEKNDATIEFPTPIVSMEWLNGSNVMIVLSHLAGGSYLSMIHQVDGKWRRLDLDPPGVSSARYSVVSVDEVGKRIKVKYKIRYHGGNDGYSYGSVEFGVKVPTGKAVDLVSKELTFDEYRSLMEMGPNR